MSTLSKYLSLGVVTTVLTYIVYLSALQWWSPMQAYAVALALGILIQAVALVPLVFKQSLTWMNSCQAVGLYCLYACAYAAMFAGLLQLGVPAIFAPLLTIACVMPMHYLLGLRMFGHKDTQTK